MAANKLAVIINGKEFVSKEALKASNSIKGLGETTISVNNILKNAFIGAAATIIASTTALIAGAVAASKTADRIDKLSQKIGLSTQTFQELDYVLSQNGSSIDGLQMSVKTLAGAVDEAASGNVRYAEMFKKLGLSIYDTNGDLRTQEEMLKATIYALAEYPDELTRTAIASDLLGKSATALAPVFNSGKDAIAELIQEANDLNMIIGSDAIKAGARLTDAIDSIKRVWKSFATDTMTPFMESLATIATSILPTLSTVLGKFSTSIREFVDSPNFDEMNETVSVMITNAIVFMEHLPTIMKAAITDIKYSWDDLFSGDRFGRKVDEFGLKLAEVIKSFVSLVGDVILGMLTMIILPINNLVATLVNGIILAVTYLTNSVVDIVNFAINPIIDVINWIKKSDIQKSPVPKFEAFQFQTYDLEKEFDAFNTKWKASSDRFFTAITGGAETTEDQILMMDTTNREIALLNTALKENESATRDLVKKGEVESGGTPAGTPASPGASTSIPSLGETLMKQLKDSFDSSGIGQLIESPLSALMDLAETVVPLITSFSSINQLLNPLQTIFAGMMEVLEPVINNLLAPLVGILKIVGQTLGAILVPILQMLAPVIEFIGNAFIWLYNKAIMPVGNFFIQMITGISSIFVLITNGLISAINWALGWAGVNIKKLSDPSSNMTLLTAIDSASLASAGGATGSSYTGGGTGSSTSVQSVNINIYQNFNGNVIGDGGMESIGEFVVDSIRAYSGVGGNVTIVGVV